MLIGKRQKSRGFLLLEVMVSVSVLSFGILLILDSFIRPIRAMELSKDYFKAGLLLEQKIFELYSSDIAGSLSKGAFSDFNNKFSWDIRIDEREVNLRVFWKEKNEERDLAVSVYL